MKYIMQVWDDVLDRQKKILVDQGLIQFCSESVEGRNIIEMDTSLFNVYSGKVKIERDIGFAFQNGQGISYVKRMLLFGYSSFIYIVDLEYESLTERLIEETRKHLASCPLDFVLAVRVPLGRLRPSWIRKLKQMSIPLIFISADSEEDLIQAPWQRFLEAGFPVRMMFLLDQHQSQLPQKEKQSILQVWQGIVKDWRMNSYFHVSKPGEGLPLLFLKRLGMYPQKGSFDSGSDADYFMYSKDRKVEPAIEIPDVIALRGVIIKSGTTWNLEKVKGRELTSIIPEQFLPINAVFQYD